MDNKPEKVNFIIVGLGIAGAVLSLKLIERGYSIKVFDRPCENVSSSVAAGIYNPITGKNLVKTWLADDLFPTLIEFYSSTEKKLNSKFFYPLKNYRIFSSIHEANDFSSKSSIDETFIKDIYLKNFDEKFISPYGGVSIKNSGYLDVKAFIDSTRKFLVQKESINNEKFAMDSLNLMESSYGTVHFEKIIFSEGIAATENPFFSKLPIVPLKGEIIEIQTAHPINAIINKGVFLLPQIHKSEKIHLVGSTYNRDNIDLFKTEEGLKELTDKLDKMLNMNYEITNHFVGIRPSTKNRRPVIGFHPKFETIGIVNGLGTKGVSLAPFFVENFLDFIDNKADLMKDVNIERYF